MLERIENIAIDNQTMSNDDLKRLIQEKILGIFSSKKNLVDNINDYAEKAKTQRTKELYLETAKKVSLYDSKASMDISHMWLESFNDYLLQTISTNSAAIHLRNIRAVFNWCRKNENLTNYPFSKFSIEYEETRKRSLTIEDIKRLRDMPVKKNQERYRDAFMLMFYLIGVNAVDLFTASHSQVVNGRFDYKRAKTGKPYSIKIEPEAKSILEKYKGKKYLLCFCDTSDLHHFLQHMNRELRSLMDGVTSYYSRHTWATLAYNNGISIDTVSAALGHSHGSKVTNVYIDVDQKNVDEANRKVIDLLKD
jgi:integrase